MHIEKIVAAFVLATGLLTGFGLALAADGDAAAANLDKLQEQFRVLDKDVSVLKEVSASKLDAQDKRISDIGLATAQQGNHLSAISNQTTTVGNYIALTSVLVTFLVFVAGFVTYFSATRRVKEESREWFEKNTAKLQSEIEVLREKVQAAIGEIERHTEQVSTSSNAALQHVQTKKDEFDKAAGKILQSSQLKDDGHPLAIDPESVAVVERASDELKTKPEASFTAEEHFARGLSYITRQNHLSALESFRAAFKALPATAPADATARYLFAQGITLGKLDKLEEAIAVYNEMDRRFGKDESPGVREQVARGMLNKGVTLGQLGKPEEEIAVYGELSIRFASDESPGVRQQVARARNGLAFEGIIAAKQTWQDALRKSTLLAAAIKELENALLICANDDRAVVMGNLGYALFLCGDSATAVVPTRDCLKLGGEAALSAQQNDAKQYRVEPEDSDYEALLTRLWAELHPATGPSGARSQEDS